MVEKIKLIERAPANEVKNPEDNIQKVDNSLVDLPPQPMPVKKGWFGSKTKVTYVSAIVVKPSGIYLDNKVKEMELPLDAKLWKYKDNYVYSLIEYTGAWLTMKGCKYEIFDPTGTSEQLPEKLWRAVKAAPIRKVFTYHNKTMEKISLGLGIAFVIVCMAFLYILANEIGQV